MFGDRKKEILVESSVPVQSRVSLTILAELGKYWEFQNVDIRSLSQLVSWSLEFLRDVLKSNGVLPEEIEDVGTAREYLKLNGLRQRSLEKRSRRKFSSALMMRNLRNEGVRPEEYVPAQFKMLHNKRSVKSLGENFSDVNSVKIELDEESKRRKKLLDRALEAYKKIEEEEMKKSLEKQIEDFKRSNFVIENEEIKTLKPPIENFESGVKESFEKDVVPTVKENMSDEEWERKKMEIEKRDKERFEMEKKVDLEFLKTLMVEPKDDE